MGLFKKTTPWSEALKEYSNSINNLAEAEQAKASETRRAVEHEENMKKMEIEAQERKMQMELNAQKAEKFQSLGNEGTADAYRKLFSARSGENKQRDENLYPKNMKDALAGSIIGSKKNKSMDNLEDVEQTLESFPFDKDPIEFRKIWIFLKQEAKKTKSIDTEQLEFISKQMEKMETAAEMNIDKPDFSNLLPDIKQTTNEIKAKVKGFKKKVLIIVGIVIFVLFLLGILALK